MSRRQHILRKYNLPFNSKVLILISHTSYKTPLRKDSPVIDKRVEGPKAQGVVLPQFFKKNLWILKIINESQSSPFGAWYSKSLSEMFCYFPLLHYKHT